MTPALRSGIVAGVLALIADQASKLWLLFVFDIGRNGAVRVTPFFDLVLAWNTGISYGWFQNDSPAGAAILLAIKALAVVLLAVWMARSHTRMATIGLGLIIGGAIGNAIDRFAYGHVIDYILFHTESWSFAVFNLADSFITIGAGCVILDELLVPKKADR